jgi:hypothetical protein
VTPVGACGPAFSVPLIELKATVGSTNGRMPRLSDRATLSVLAPKFATLMPKRIKASASSVAFTATSNASDEMISSTK